MLRPANICAALMAAAALASGCGPDDGGDFEAEVEEVEVALAAPGAKGVTLGGDTTEATHRVPIRDKPHQWRVAYSVQVDDLAVGEWLLVRGEVTVSRCNKDDIAGNSNQGKNTPCYGINGYGYDPNLSVGLILADKPGSTKGKQLTKAKNGRCTEKLHHCARDIAGDYVVKANRARKFVNLVVSANAKNAGTGDVVEIEPLSGGLHVIRAGAQRGAPSEAGNANILLDGGTLPIFDDDACAPSKRRVVYRTPIAVSPGDILDVAGDVHVTNNSGITPLFGSMLLLTANPEATAPGGPADRILPKNGSNCASGTGCTTSNVGAFQVPAGAQDTMYLNVIAYATRQAAKCDGSQTVHVDGGFVRLEKHSL